MKIRSALLAALLLLPLPARALDPPNDMARVGALYHEINGELKDRKWEAVYKSICNEPEVAIQGAELGLQLASQPGREELRDSTRFYASLVARVLLLKANRGDFQASLEKRGLALPLARWDFTPLADAGRMKQSEELMARLKTCQEALLPLLLEWRRQTLPMARWDAQTEFAGTVEDYRALIAIDSQAFTEAPPALVRELRNEVSIVAQLQAGGFSTGQLGEGAPDQLAGLENDGQVRRAFATSLEGTMGMRTKALEDGEKLLPATTVPRARALILSTLVHCSLECGYAEQARKYLTMANSTGLFDRFQLGVDQLSLETEERPDFPASLFLERYRQLWPLFKDLKRSSVAAAARMVLMSARIRRRVGADDPSAAALQAAQNAMIADLERLGQAYQVPPVLYEHLNPAWKPWAPIELALARIEMAADARIDGDLSAARAQLEAVRPLLAELERIVPLLEPLGKKIFEGSGVTVNVRAGYFSTLPAAYHEELGRLLNAESAPPGRVLAELDQALALFRTGDHAEANALQLVPERELVAVRGGAPVASAVAAVQEALRASEARSLRRATIAAHLALGQLAAPQGGQTATAVRELSMGLNLLEQALTEMGGEGPEAAALRLQARPAYELLTRLHSDAGKPAEAFAVLARMQQAASLGAVSPGSSSDPKLDSALQQMHGDRVRLARLEAEGETVRSAPPSELQRQAAPRNSALVASARTQLSEHLGAVTRLNAEFEKLAIRAVDFSRVQQAIPEDTVVAEYLPTERQLYIFVLSRESLKIRTVPVDGKSLADAAHHYRTMIMLHPTDPAGRADALASAYALHRDLIDPIEADLKGKSVLAVIAGGDLVTLPFAALARPGGARPQYLVERFQTVSLLRSSDVDLLERAAGGRPGGRLMAFGNPDGSLAGAEQEVRDIEKLFPGAAIYLESQATRAPLATLDKSGVAYLHFATHGVLDGADPRASHLVLAGSNLTVDQIAGLSLGKDLRLVTLSACQTAVGKSATRVELLESMADAFGYAGSPSVVASLWSVADDSTRMLMDELYRQLKSGASRSLALQQASLKVARSERYSSPYFWAPFVLTGDWR